jgi:hypothetical protein
MTTIGIIGDHDPSNQTHVATDDALGHSAATPGGTTLLCSARAAGYST